MAGTGRTILDALSAGVRCHRAAYGTRMSRPGTARSSSNRCARTTSASGSIVSATALSLPASNRPVSSAMSARARPGSAVRQASSENLALAGHLSPTGKGRATPAELADDLLGYLRAAA